MIQKKEDAFEWMVSLAINSEVEEETHEQNRVPCHCIRSSI